MLYGWGRKIATEDVHHEYREIAIVQSISSLACVIKRNAVIGFLEHLKTARYLLQLVLVLAIVQKSQHTELSAYL